MKKIVFIPLLFAGVVLGSVASGTLFEVFRANVDTSKTILGTPMPMTSVDTIRFIISSVDTMAGQAYLYAETNSLRTTGVRVDSFATLIQREKYGTIKADSLMNTWFAAGTDSTTKAQMKANAVWYWRVVFASSATGNKKKTLYVYQVK